MNADRNSLFLMANLGSEVSRLLSFKEKGDLEEAKKSCLRSEQILNQISDCPDMKSRQPEIIILKDIIEDLVVPKNRYSIIPEDLRNYFTPFAARLLK